jgi:hypothetical protein
MTETFEFTLLENGLDFIVSGLRAISTASSKSDLKYGVLHLTSGIELVLKERLRREDWRLLFENPEKATEELYNSGNFKSVSLEECLERLEECGVDLDPKHRKRLKSFRAKRNRLEHFRISDTKEAIEGSAASALEVLLLFVREEIGSNELSKEEEKLLLEIHEKVGEFRHFTDVRLQNISAEMEAEKANYAEFISCPPITVPAVIGMSIEYACLKLACSK